MPCPSGSLRVGGHSPDTILAKMIAEGQGEELDKMIKTYVPMQRLGRAEEIADAVLWLCSSASSYVTASRSQSMAASSCASGEIAAAS